MMETFTKKKLKKIDNLKNVNTPEKIVEKPFIKIDWNKVEKQKNILMDIETDEKPKYEMNFGEKIDNE